MSWAVLIILLIGFTYLISNSSELLGLSKKILLIGWGLKLVFAALFLLIFTYYYSDGRLFGDVANFMNDSEVLADYGRSNPSGYFNLLFGFSSNDLALMQNELADTQIWSYGDNGDFINDNRLIIRINSVIQFFSFGNVWVHLLFFAFISFIGILFLYKTFEKLSQNQHLLFFSLIAFPTIGFWSSGITKECLMVFATGIFFWGFSKLLMKENNKWSRLTLVIGLAMLLFNKPHLGLALIIFLPFFYWMHKTGSSKKKTVISLLFVCLIGIALSFAPAKINPVNRISHKLQDFKNIGTGGVFFITDSSFCAFDYDKFDRFNYDSDSSLISTKQSTLGEYKLFGEETFHPFTIPRGDKKYDVYLVQPPSKSIVDVPSINDSGSQLIKNIPLALLNTFLRPFPTDTGSNLKYLSMLENLLFICLLIYTLKNRNPLNDNQKKWVFLLLSAAVALILLIGLTTPILGAIARYKIAPYLLFIIAFSIILKPISIFKK